MVRHRYIFMHTTLLVSNRKRTNHFPKPTTSPILRTLLDVMSFSCPRTVSSSLHSRPIIPATGSPIVQIDGLRTQINLVYFLLATTRPKRTLSIRSGTTLASEVLDHVAATSFGRAVSKEAIKQPTAGVYSGSG